MGLETGTYISDLNTSNPASGDAKSQGDDHLRLIKTCIRNTWPNVSSAITPTHTELNYVDGVTSAIQTQLDSKAPTANPTFTGTATIASATVSGTLTIPTQAASDSTTKAASTAMVQAAILNASLSAELPDQATHSGQFLTTDGSNVSWDYAQIADYQEFTSSGTWTKPAGATWVYVEAIGGGGSGGADSGTNAAGGGSGGEYVSRLMLATTCGATETVTIGDGGIGVASASHGNSGGTTTFGSLVSAVGGNPGQMTSVVYATIPRSTSTTASNASMPGSFWAYPQAGRGGWATDASTAIVGGDTIYGGAGGGASATSASNGGTSALGGNGGAGATTGTATAGSVPGGGGGGCSGGGTSGAGGKGRVRVWSW